MDKDLITTSLINKNNNIIKYLEKFDSIFKILIETTGESADIIHNITEITQLYIFIRSEHGSLILLLDEIKNNINTNESDKISDELINKLYTLSTFYSIIENVSGIISNIDYQYKKIASKFTKFINKKILTLLLIVKNNEEAPDEKENKFIEIMHQIQKESPENVYKIIKTNNKNVNIKDIIGIEKNLELEITKNPSLFIINNDVITEISLEKNSTFEEIKKLIS
jgi:hypothetical protein